MTDSMIETGLTFVSANGGNWRKHVVALDVDYVRAHLDEERQVTFDALDLMEKILVVRAVTELALLKWRETNDDPAYDPNQYPAWRKVLEAKLGPIGWEMLGV